MIVFFSDHLFFFYFSKIKHQNLLMTKSQLKIPIDKALLNLLLSTCGDDEVMTKSQLKIPIDKALLNLLLSTCQHKVLINNRSLKTE